tara:strand:+ start:170 stop:535 length:366 start_codon:yes stop_codon:yes gene_type:complete
MDLISVNAQIKANQYLAETLAQLEKDFLMIGVNFDIEKPIVEYKTLFAFTNNLVNSLNEQNPKLILNLLYRIDLSEEMVQKQMQETSLSFSEMLSELIVKRELYKVVLRKKISYPFNFLSQ